MAQQPTPWPPSAGRPSAPARSWVVSPSGLFPSGPPRPTYREPHPVRGGLAAAGGGAAFVWSLFFGLLGTDLRGYAWWTLLAGLLSWVAALVLARVGDRGVAVGIAAVTAVSWSVATAVVGIAWAVTGDWPLW